MRYSFADFVLDTDRRELRHRDALVAVEPQIFDLLEYLIRHRERVVTKEELRSAIWQGRIVSESTLSSSVTGVRAAIGDNGQDQQFVRTLPRVGFRFIAPVDGAEGPPVLKDLIRVIDDHVEIVAPPSHAVRRPRIWIAITCVVIAVMAAGVFAALQFARRGAPAKQFVAENVPLLPDDVRQTLAVYGSLPDFKAIALALGGYGIAKGARDEEAAKREALQACDVMVRSRAVCQIYAVGMNVVWSDELLPLPAAADIRIDPLDTPVTPESIGALLPTMRQSIEERYLPLANHRAIATDTTRTWFVTRRRSREEAVRMALEQCSMLAQRPCLVLAVDGFLTLNIPRMRKVAGVFLPATEPGIAQEDRAAIAKVYQGAEWRALTRGKRGWYPIGTQPSEEHAIAASHQDCTKKDSECRLYAIGNFRVQTD